MVSDPNSWYLTPILEESLAVSWRAPRLELGGRSGPLVVKLKPRSVQMKKILSSHNEHDALFVLRPPLGIHILIPMLFGGVIVCLLIATAIGVGWRIVEWNFIGLLLISTISLLLSLFAYVRGRKTTLYNDRIYDQRWHIIANTWMLRDVLIVSSRRNFSNIVFSRIEIVHRVSGKRVLDVLNAGLYNDEEVDRFCEYATSIIQQEKRGHTP